MSSTKHLEQLNSKSLLSQILIPLTWLIFLANTALIIYYFSDFPTWTLVPSYRCMPPIT